MAKFVFQGRVKETTTSTGTGTVTLDGAVSGFRTVASVAADGDFIPYVLTNSTVTSEWEEGIGTLSGADFVRTAVGASSNANAAVSFSAGTKVLFIGGRYDESWWRERFGDGSHGDLTSSSGTTNLSSDAMYRTVTLTGTAKIDVKGNRLRCWHLDLSAAGAAAVFSSAATDGSLPYGGAGAGVVGQTQTDTAGLSGQAANTHRVGNGGAGGAGGAGGTDGARAGGAGGAGGTATTGWTPDTFTTLSGVRGALGGGGGGSGGTNDALDSGAGSNGANGAPVLWISAFKITRGASTTAGAITGTGDAGVAGSASGNAAGGGGGGGGAGGTWVAIWYAVLAGSQKSGAVVADGGAGGAGGDSTGSNGGDGGGGGNAGRYTLYNVLTDTVITDTTGTAGSAGSAQSGGTGGAGGAGGTLSGDL